MIRRLLTYALTAVMAAVTGHAEDRWVHVFRTEGGKARVTSLPVEDIVDNTYDEAPDGGVTSMSFLTTDGRDISVDLCTVDSCVIGTNIPTMYIDIDDGREVEDKEHWLHASVWLRGYGSTEDLGEAEVTVKGRGNSTWGYPKKPYTVKFKKKTAIGPLNEAKNFVLLANYIDNTLMRNVVAFKTAQLMGMPYTNHFQPVNLVVNGTYRGSYLLTEKVGINAGSVNIDEQTGILFELDTNYDEEYKFHSEVYGLPVMVKDPDFNDLPGVGTPQQAETMFEAWRADFQKMENAVAGISGTGYKSLLDMQSAVDYLLVNTLCANREINHPKSVYLYKKTIKSKYYLGPVWDFDWAFTFGPTEWNVPPTQTLLTVNNSGARFFRAIANDADFVWKYVERWRYFRDQVFPRLLTFMDSYAESILVSALQNGERWPQEALTVAGAQSTESIRENYARFRQWLIDRVDYIDTAPHMGLY